MNCLESLDMIFAYIDGQITDQETLDEIEEHLRHCRRCYNVVMFEKRVQSFVQDACRCEEVPLEAYDRARKILNRFSEY